MRRCIRLVLSCALVMAVVASVRAAEGDKVEMADNPFHTFWKDFKPGSTQTYTEKTKLTGEAAKEALDGMDEKVVACKLIEVGKRGAIVETVVTEPEFFGRIASAPTRHIYPAQLKKSHLERVMSAESKKGEGTVEFKGKELKCQTLSGTVKINDDTMAEYKAWLNPEVPGYVVKLVRTTKQKGEVVAETTRMLQAYKAAE